MELEKTIRQSLHILVFLGCFLFTLFQTILCIIKYDSFPKGTLSKLLPADQVGKDNFPAITICSHRKMKDVTGFNESILKKCQIREGYKAYSDPSQAHWALDDIKGESLDANCTDPKILFESIVAKPSDLIGQIVYEFENERNGSRKTAVRPSQHYDVPIDGRCFTTVPTEDMVSRGITSIMVLLKLTEGTYAPWMLFHTPEYFPANSKHRKHQAYQFDANFSEVWYVEYEIHTKLKRGTMPPCEDETGYEYDKCLDQYVEKVSLDRFGCTTPFAKNKNNICTNKNAAKEALRLYKRLHKSESNPCLTPCKTLSIRAMKQRQQPRLESNGYTQIRLNLKDKVLIAEEISLYSGLSLISEIGGNVGLFLGISVNQVSHLLETIFDQFNQYFRSNGFNLKEKS